MVAQTSGIPFLFPPCKPMMMKELLPLTSSDLQSKMGIRSDIAVDTHNCGDNTSFHDEYEYEYECGEDSPEATDEKKIYCSKKRKRIVSFNPTLEVINCRKESDNDDDDDNAVIERWISQRELKRYRLDIVRTFNLLRKSESASDVNVNDDEVCTRGMEAFLDRSSKQGRKQVALQAVLKAQSLQSNMDHNNPEIVAKIYSLYTKGSLHQAIRRAIQDQRDVWAQQGYKLGSNTISS